MAVYFAEGVGGLIKIGRSEWPRRRVASLRFRGERPTLVAVAPASDDVSLERDLHWKHGPDRVTGEWFAPTPSVLASMTNIGRKDAEALATNEMRGWHDAKIRALRLALGLTQEELGRRVGMSRLNVLHLEAGRRRLWGHEPFSRFARGVGLSIAGLDAYLTGGASVEDTVAIVATTRAA